MPHSTWTCWIWQELTGNTEPFKNTQHHLLHWDSTLCCIIQAFVSSKKMFSKYFVTMTVQPWTLILPLVTPENPCEVKCVAQIVTASQAAGEAHLAVQPPASSWACVLCTALSAWVIACHKLRPAWRNNIISKRKRGLQLWSTKYLPNMFSFNQEKPYSHDSRMKNVKHRENEAQKDISTLRALFQVKTCLSGTLIWKLYLSRYSPSPQHSPKKSSGAFPYDSGSPTNTSAEQDQQGVYIQQRHVNGRLSLWNECLHCH